SIARHATAFGRRRQLLLLLLALCVCLNCGLSANSGGNADVDDAHPLRQGSHKLCGQALNVAMDAVCVNGYNTMRKKRMDSELALSGGLEANALQLQPQASGYARSPLLSSIYGTEVLIKTRRLRRDGPGIHTECCLDSCTYPELLAYCKTV
ncbi:Ilp1, partial [Drosophila busckii]